MRSDAWTLTIGSAVLCLGAALWAVRTGGHETTAVDLIQTLPAAKLQPDRTAFDVVTATVAGVTKTAIATGQVSRITWDVVVPRRASWKLSVAVSERDWSWPGTVRFVAGVSSQAGYLPLAAIDLDPSAGTADRRWRYFELDLSAYEGQSVRLICNAAPLTAPPDDRGFALIGEPRVVVR
jgi:hypothetical protein